MQVNKEEVAKKLCVLFWCGEVWGWLDTFSDDHKFTDTYVQEYVDYLGK